MNDGNENEILRRESGENSYGGEQNPFTQGGQFKFRVVRGGPAALLLGCPLMLLMSGLLLLLVAVAGVVGILGGGRLAKYLLKKAGKLPVSDNGYNVHNNSDVIDVEGEVIDITIDEEYESDT